MAAAQTVESAGRENPLAALTVRRPLSKTDFVNHGLTKSSFSKAPGALEISSQEGHRARLSQSNYRERDSAFPEATTRLTNLPDSFLDSSHDEHRRRDSAPPPILSLSNWIVVRMLETLARRSSNASRCDTYPRGSGARLAAPGDFPGVGPVPWSLGVLNRPIELRSQVPPARPPRYMDSARGLSPASDL